MEQHTKELFQKFLNDGAIVDYFKESNKVWFLERRDIFDKELSIDLVTILYFCMNSG